LLTWWFLFFSWVVICCADTGFLVFFTA
jgi:hypothetical protein